MLDTVARGELPTVQEFSFNGRNVTCPIGELTGLGRMLLSGLSPRLIICFCFWAMGQGQSVSGISGEMLGLHSTSQTQCSMSLQKESWGLPIKVVLSLTNG